MAVFRERRRWRETTSGVLLSNSGSFKNQRWGRGDLTQSLLMVGGTFPLIETFANLPEERGEDAEFCPGWLRIVAEGLDNENYYPYDFVRYVFECNVEAEFMGNFIDTQKIWHAAVLFQKGRTVNRVMLFESNEDLEKIQGSLPASKILAYTGRSVMEERIYCNEVPNYSEVAPYNHRVIVKEFWSSSQERKQHMDGLAAFKRKQEERGLKVIPITSFCYKLELGFEPPLLLNFCAAFNNYDGKKTCLIQRDDIAMPTGWIG